VLTPLRIFLKFFSNALTLRFTRRVPFLVIKSVHVSFTAAHSWSLERLVAVTGYSLTYR